MIINGRKYEIRKIPGDEYHGYSADSDGDIFGPRGYPLKARVDQDGYKCVSISQGKKKFTRKVHQLVCMAFHGPRPEGKLALHEDDDKLNNLWENIYWGTHSENGQDAVRNGKQAILFGDLNGNFKCSNTEVVTIKERLAKGDRGIDIAADFGVSKSLISQIKSGDKRARG